VNIKAIVGLGNPGPQYYYQRHSIGFRILDALADHYHLDWQRKKQGLQPYDQAVLQTDHGPVLLIKPLTFMNSSGTVLPAITKIGIDAPAIMVVHDELEKPAGSITLKQGGSHKGHNGLKSVIQYIGPDFFRLRIGIGRPAQKEDVPEYVLKPFELPKEQVDALIDQAVQEITKNIW
jgi:peptidyl-tRNA hydrolase, PTH1 family